MLRFRSFCALLTALAVFVVSNTCSQGACLLPMGVAHRQQPAAAVKSCCEESPPAGSQSRRAPVRDQRCPMCQGAVVAAKDVEQGHGPELAALTVLFFAPIPTASVLTACEAITAHPVIDHPLPAGNSLLAQHCALLN